MEALYSGVEMTTASAEAIARRDYTLTQALVMLVATFFLVVNFAVDIAYAWLDPRIRYR